MAESVVTAYRLMQEGRVSVNVSIIPYYRKPPFLMDEEDQR